MIENSSYSSSDAPPQHNQIDLVKADVDKVLQATFELNQTIYKRNQERLQILEELRDILPNDQYDRFEHSLSQQANPRQNSQKLDPIVIDDQNPLDSLRRERCRLAQEVCNVMSVYNK